MTDLMIEAAAIATTRRARTAIRRWTGRIRAAVLVLNADVKTQSSLAVIRRLHHRCPAPQA
jgi:phage baseplate assembly protein W